MKSKFITTPDEWLATVPKKDPEMIQVLSLNREDVLVVCAGFEERALASIRMAKHSSNHGTIIVISYAPFLTTNRDAEFFTEFPHFTIQHLQYDREDPAGFGAFLSASIPENSGFIYVDISAMSRLLIVQAIVALSQRASGLKNCSIIYTEAVDYPPSKEEASAVLLQSSADPAFSALFLSSGVFEVTIVPELSSVSPAPTQSRLVVFPAFDVHHLTALHAELQPSRISFIEGVPPDESNAWRKKMIAELNHLDSFAESERLQTSTFRYAETLDELIRLYQLHGLRDRILIAPTGSKMQTIAVGLIRAFLTDTQIVYSTPRGFVSPDNYTRGVGNTYEVDLSIYQQPDPK